MENPYVRQKEVSPFYNPDDARRKAIENFLGMGSDIVQDRDFNPMVEDKYNWAVKAQNAGSDAAQFSYQNALNTANAQAQQSANEQIANQQQQGGLTDGDVRFREFFRAMRAQESGGNYSAVNPDSGAMGAFQIMPANIQGDAGWDMEALGQNITTQQFLESKKLQNQIARYKLRQYFGEHGVRGAASAWYSGDPNRWKEKTPQGDYPSVYNYVQAILRRLGLA